MPIPCLTSAPPEPIINGKITGLPKTDHQSRSHPHKEWNIVLIDEVTDIGAFFEGIRWSGRGRGGQGKQSEQSCGKFERIHSPGRRIARVVKVPMQMKAI